MKRLLRIGFEKAGHWALNKDGLEIVLERNADKTNALYAFAVKDEVKYVGKTTRPLARRMYGYLKPGPTQSTNIKNKHIRSALSSGKEVTIYVLVDSGLHTVGDFHLNLAAGLEDSLISTLRPEWNGGSSKNLRIHGRMTESTSRKRKSTSELEGKPESGTPSIHTFHLRPTYLKQGFFNVPVAAEKFYGRDNEAIEVLVGRSKKRIVARINRSVNVNNTPRIMGGVPLRDLFTVSFGENELAQVTVLTPNQIQISRVR